MTVTAWPQGVNTRFFAYSKKPKENTVTTEFTGGRTVTWKKNTRDVFQITCRLEVSRPDEEALFWQWYTAALGGKSGAFTCPALGDSYYRFAEIPEPQDTEQRRRVLELQIEEVY